MQISIAGICVFFVLDVRFSIEIVLWKFMFGKTTNYNL